MYFTFTSLQYFTIDIITENENPFHAWIGMGWCGLPPTFSPQEKNTTY